MGQVHNNNIMNVSHIIVSSIMGIVALCLFIWVFAGVGEFSSLTTWFESCEWKVLTGGKDELHHDVQVYFPFRF